MNLEASPFWQDAFLVGVLVAMGWSIWNGWRVGVVRALVSMAGLVLFTFVAVIGFVLVGAVAGAIFPVAGGILGLLSGCLLGLVAYAVVYFLGALLFKRTAQQRTLPLRLVYGIGGALIGVFVAVSVFWGALLFVRGFGGICEGASDPKGQNWVMLPKPVTMALIKMKRSVDAGSTGRLLESLDIIPAKDYRMMEKFGRVLSNPESLKRLVAYPGITDAFSSLHLVDLARDPEIQDLVSSHREAELFTNEKLQAAVKNPALLEKLQKVDIEKALDYALSPPAPAHTPHSPHP